MEIETTTNLLTLQESRELLLLEISAIEVSGNTIAIASDSLIRLRAFLKEADKRRTEDKEPYLRGGQLIDKAYADTIRPVKDAELKLSNSISLWHRAEADARAKEQARLDRLAEKQFEKAQATGSAVIPEPVSREAEPIVKQVKTEAGTLSFKTIRTWRYATDSQKVKATSRIPDEYWIVDEKKIQRLVAGGILQIPGIVIEETSTPAARASRA